MQLKLSDMPDGIIVHSHLHDIATTNGYVYCKIHQGMYGLLQAGIIAQELLATRLKEHSYTQSKTRLGCGHTSGTQSLFLSLLTTLG
jgi:hypothetical protein